MKIKAKKSLIQTSKIVLIVATVIIILELLSFCFFYDNESIASLLTSLCCFMCCLACYLIVKNFYFTVTNKLISFKGKDYKLDDLKEVTLKNKRFTFINNNNEEITSFEVDHEDIDELKEMFKEYIVDENN